MLDVLERRVCVLRLGIGGWLNALERAFVNGGEQSQQCAGKVKLPTQWNIVIALYRDILRFLDIVHTLEDGESMAKA